MSQNSTGTLFTWGCSSWVNWIDDWPLTPQQLVWLEQLGPFCTHTLVFTPKQHTPSLPTRRLAWILI